MTAAGGARPLLLAAARRIVLRDGAGRLTIQAVAAEAGVSRGGLLYHFASKDELLEALILEQIGAIDDPDRIPDPDTPGAAVRAYLAASLTSADVTSEPSSPVSENALMAAMAAAVALRPDLLGPLRKLWLQWQERIENDGIDPAVATLARLAIDGLVLADAYDIAPITGPMRQRVVNLIQELLEPPPPLPSERGD